jgi:hypothetical protein
VSAGGSVAAPAGRDGVEHAEVINVSPTGFSFQIVLRTPEWVKCVRDAALMDEIRTRRFRYSDDACARARELFPNATIGCGT